jgi:hypothetical protein
MVTAQQAGNDTYAPTGLGRTINFLKSSQSISFTTPPNRDLNTLNPLTVSASSGLPVTLTSSTPATCSIVETGNGGYAAQAVAGIPADTSKCIIVATQAGNEQYASTSTSRTFTWTRTYVALKATRTTPYSIDGSPLDIVINNASGTQFSETVTGSTPLTITSLTPKVCTVGAVQYQGSSTSHTRATIKALWNGTCQINISFAGNTSLNSALLVTAVTISGITTPQPGAYASQAISFSPQSGAPFGTRIQLLAKATSNLPVAITTSTPNICALSQNSDGTYTVTSAAGLVGDTNNCILQAAQAGNSGWAPAPTVTRTIRWIRMPQVITFNPPYSRYFGGAPTVLTATSTSGGPVTFRTTTPAVCKIDTVDSQTVVNYVLPLTSATYVYCNISAAQAGNDTYSPAPITNRSIVFNKERTVVTGTWAGAITTAGTKVELLVKSASMPSLNESLAGEAPLVVTSQTPRVCKVDSITYVGSTTSHTQATVKSIWNGTCQLLVTFAGNSYWLASQSGISKTISGMTTPEPGASAFQSIGLSTPSTSDISAIVPIAPVAGSRLPVAVRTTTPNVCTVTPTTTGYSITTAAGVIGNGNICTIEATQTGDDRWSAAAPVIRSITFSKAAMSVRLNRLSTVIVGKTSALFVVENRYLNSTMNKGLNSIGHISTAVSNTPAVCSVSNVAPYVQAGGTHTQFTVTGLVNGNCSVTFGYAGGDTQNAAYRTQAITVTGVK